MLAQQWKIIPYAPKYSVSRYGGIRLGATGEEAKTYVDDRGTLRAVVYLMPKTPKHIRVAHAVLSAYVPPPEDTNPVMTSVMFKDLNRLNVRLDNLFWDFNGVYPSQVPGVSCPIDAYVRIPGYWDFEIDISGKVRNFLTKETVRVDIVNGYARVKLHDGKAYRHTTIHRLLALTFLPHAHDTQGLVVNHKDGNGLNNNLDNLEWATYSDNLNHAYATGLQTDITAVKGLNIATREEISFRSMNEAARHIGVNPGAVFAATSLNAGFREYNGYYLKKADDPRTWPPPNWEQPLSCCDGKAIIMRDATSLEETVCASATEAGRAIGCDASSILLQANKPVPIIYKNKQIRWYTGTSPVWPVITDVDLFVAASGATGPKVNPLRIVDTTTGTSALYISTKQAAQTFGVDPSSLGYFERRPHKLLKGKYRVERAVWAGGGSPAHEQANTTAVGPIVAKSSIDSSLTAGTH